MAVAVAAAAAFSIQMAAVQYAFAGSTVLAAGELGLLAEKSAELEELSAQNFAGASVSFAQA